MNAIMLIKELQDQGVTLWIEGNNLRYKGPSQVINPIVLQLLKSKKQEIIRLKKYTGYGCGNCGNKIYQIVQQWVTYTMSYFSDHDP